MNESVEDSEIRVQFSDIFNECYEEYMKVLNELHLLRYIPQFLTPYEFMSAHLPFKELIDRSDIHGLDIPYIKRKKMIEMNDENSQNILLYLKNLLLYSNIAINSYTTLDSKTQLICQNILGRRRTQLTNRKTPAQIMDELIGEMREFSQQDECLNDLKTMIDQENSNRIDQTPIAIQDLIQCITKRVMESPKDEPNVLIKHVGQMSEKFCQKMEESKVSQMDLLNEAFKHFKH